MRVTPAINGVRHAVGDLGARGAHVYIFGLEI